MAKIHGGVFHAIYLSYTFKHQPHKMVKHTQTIRRLTELFGLTLKGL